MSLVNRTIYVLGLTALAALFSGCGQSATENTAAEAAAVDLPTIPLIDPNTATDAMLNQIPGLTPAAVEAVVGNRPFATPSELHAALSAHLSEEVQSEIYRAMFVKVGLNSGAEEDFKLIPSSMSPGKLAHEFEEYRPYESIDQFRREMSKYVSDAEVAYLARYVTLD